VHFPSASPATAILVHRLARHVALAIACIACGKDSGTGVDEPGAGRPVDWTDDAWTQPVPSWGSPVRLNLPVALSAIVLGETGGLGAFGAHEGGHTEGLNHVWIPTIPGTTIRSWADGIVTKIEDMGDRGLGNGQHEYFITIDYGRGLIGKHLDVDVPLVKVGDAVHEGTPVARAPSAEFNLIDNYRSDGERTGGSLGSPVSPFDYLRDDVKAALVARHVAEVVEPSFRRSQVTGNSRPWEPYLTNKMLYHADHRGTIVGEWILVNKGWRTPDPVYFDVMAVFDVTNAYGHFQTAELGDHDWSKAGNKNHAVATWNSSDGAGQIVFTIDRGPTWYGLFTVDESSGRARLTMEWKQGSYPTVITTSAAIYVERAPIYLGADAQQLGLGG
jgi:hypothetical protein